MVPMIGCLHDSFSYALNGCFFITSQHLSENSNGESTRKRHFLLMAKFPLGGYPSHRSLRIFGVEWRYCLI